MAPASEQCVAIFAKAPSSVLDGRPETDHNFLMWLAPRMSVIAECALHDQELRNLESKYTLKAIESMEDMLTQLQFNVLAEMLRRGLVIFRQTQNNAYAITRHGGIEALVEDG